MNEIRDPDTTILIYFSISQMAGLTNEWERVQGRYKVYSVILTY